MGMLRSLVGARWDEFVRNVDIRERLRQPPVSLKLRKARLKWFGHAQRMMEDRPPKRLANVQMKGGRPIGRPRTRWKEVLQRDLESIDLNLEEAAVEALNWERWREIVLASCDS
jgi:hypothetical protein